MSKVTYWIPTFLKYRPIFSLRNCYFFFLYDTGKRIENKIFGIEYLKKNRLTIFRKMNNHLTLFFGLIYLFI